MKKIFSLAIGILFLSNCLNAQIADSLRIHDTRSVNNPPSSFTRIAKFDFKINQAIGLPILDLDDKFSGVLSIAPYVDNSGGANIQIAFNSNGLFHRYGYSNKSGNYKPELANNQWRAWNKIIMGDSKGVIQSKLEVNGTIRAKEVKIEVTGWADFVFSEDYKLPSLSEVENHIKENKHLPDIPSEKEMIENGVNINEMQIKLLQKIEELTLYVIEQNKKIEKLETENQEIKKQLESNR